MPHAPKKRVRRSTRREMPDQEISRPPKDVTENGYGRYRPQHEVPETFVERQKIPGRQEKCNEAHPPVGHPRLQNHGRNPDLPAPKMPAEQREVFPESPRDGEGNPIHALGCKFGNHHQRELRKDLPHVLDRCGNQVLGARSEQDLDGFAQISTWRLASNALFLRSSH